MSVDHPTGDEPCLTWAKLLASKRLREMGPAKPIMFHSETHQIFKWVAPWWVKALSAAGLISVDDWVERWFNRHRRHPIEGDEGARK